MLMVAINGPFSMLFVFNHVDCATVRLVPREYTSKLGFLGSILQDGVRGAARHRRPQLVFPHGTLNFSGHTVVFHFSSIANPLLTIPSTYRPCRQYRELLFF